MCVQEQNCAIDAYKNIIKLNWVRLNIMIGFMQIDSQIEIAETHKHELAENRFSLSTNRPKRLS